ncbi:glycosyltransferase family 2 protein [Flagellimonas zhangzhouensis]|uniref:Glycosyltransferase involved in cell wall bisynthesis n=1 Tax=Flagellimonas zhangzhouensis TaxID=1073328 RepID=A0A1H2VLJ4_9FLAO|nr:glycosyltransferase family 2 protein [Allomuricauda zhangzhouensis]SDQ07042.1 Glycosyltransferase involved in cell wall bisynthesis [Allomuricauda zhangzhouensis]SDW69196.1 Glycosyltransferase involved in cell wall bisynthesis [Allomuricauda zhangzhouensis]
MADIKVIIPAYNEEDSIGKVVAELPKHVSEIIVVDNASTDETAANASKAGATVLSESNKGYGFACLKGLKYISEQSKAPDIIVFIDGDYSDYPEELDKIVAPILENRVVFVVGARKKSLREPGSMTPQQVFGNDLATFLMRLFFRSKFTDLGPFRAIKYDNLKELKMQDTTYGWTVEMQLKILRKKMPYIEVPVRYKRRIGVSKVSGTVKGTIFAGIKILGWIFKYSLK